MLRRFGGADDDDTDSEVMSEDADLGFYVASDAIIEKLAQSGFPEEVLAKRQAGVSDYIRSNPGELPKLVASIFPDINSLIPRGSDDVSRQAIAAHFQEALHWLEWCAFGEKPQVALEEVRVKLGGVRGICGAVWGSNDLAYRCHTCEHDQTCAICVACFQNGDHSSHDYAMIRTNGGCCDCGDATAWKESGFCSRHRGTGQVPQLPESLVKTLTPVLEALFLEWESKLLAASHASAGRSRKWRAMTAEEKLASQMSLSIVLRLLDYCNSSESMLNFTAENVSRRDIGLLDTLMTTERFLPKQVTAKLHELLYKLLGVPNFKYQFAQDFIKHYPKFLHDTIFDDHLPSSRRREHNSILGGAFSVQLFTVPTLTPRLVMESKLLDLLFGTLKDFFLHCIGEDGRFMVSKSAVQERAYGRALEDLKYIMSHLKVAQYVIHEFPQLCRTWLQFLAFIQGMYPQKRITGIHTEEENEDWVSAFYLESQMADVHPLLVAGTSEDQAVVDDAGEWLYYRKFSSDEDAPTTSAKQQFQTEAYAVIEGVSLAKGLIWLISECVALLDSWFAVDALRDSSRSFSSQGPSQRRKLHLRVRFSWLPDGESGPGRRRSLDEGLVSDSSQEEASQMEVDASPTFSPEAGSSDWWMGSEDGYGTGLSLLVGDLWRAYDFDVAKHEVSFHIPLHRMLARLLLKALEEYESKKNAADVAASSAGHGSKFLLQLLPEPFRVSGFAALLMEHPLRLQALCAQVQAGMWRRNGHTIIGVCDIYRSVQWCEGSLELDLFMLQCCAAMAPAEQFVGRVLCCFGLSDYFPLFLWRPNEYEPFLAQEFLVLIIRIISERGFCGLSPKDLLRRELIQRLAIGDASRSVLLNALPPRLQDSKHLQETLEAVASYRKPQGMQQGKYVLRQESWRELDLYHPRWTPRELQAAEERYLRACRASAVFEQSPRWRQPYLPLQNLANLAVSSKVHDILRAVFFHAAFSVISSHSRAPENLLFTALHLLSLGLDVCSAYHGKDRNNREKAMECDPGASFEPSSLVALQRPPLLSQAPEKVHVGGADGTQLPGRESTITLLARLMKKYVANEAEQLLVSEAAQCSVGSFIKNVLHRFAELDRECMYAIEKVAPEILHRVSADSSSKPGPSPKAEAVQMEISEMERKRAHARERQAAIMAKMRAAQDKFMVTVESSERSESKKNKVEDSRISRDDDWSAETVSPVCALCRDRSASPLCILVLVQRSRLLALAQKPEPSWDRVASKRVDEGSSVEKDSSLLVAGRRGAENLILELRQWLESAVGDRLERLENRDDFLELLRGELPSILNRDRVAASPSTRPSTERSRSETDGLPDDAESHDFSIDANWWQNQSMSKADFGENDVGLLSVLAEYVSAVSRTQADQSNTEAEVPRDTASRVRRLARSNIESKIYSSIGLNDFIGLHLSACGHAAHQECIDRYYSSVLQRHYSRSLFEGVQIVDPDLGELLCPVCRRLSNCILPVVEGGDGCLSAIDRQPEGFKLEQARSVLYNAADLMCKPGFRKAALRTLPDSLKAVLDSVASRLCGLFYPEKDHISLLADGRNFQGLFLWDLLRYSVMASELAARTKNLILGQQDPLTRLVVLEEAAEASKGSILPLLFLTAKFTMNQSGQAILLRTRAMQLMVASICHGTSRDQLSERGLKGPLKDSAEVQFWKRTADPILVHDPFSSLLWVLFTVPLPLPSFHDGPFVALVHLFYLVCLIQCIGTIGKALSVDPAIPPDVQKFVAAVSSTLEGTCVCFPPPPPEDAGFTGSSLEDVRRLTLPYLRRSALLQTVSGSSERNPMPVVGSNSWDLSNVHSLLAGSAFRDRNCKPGQAEVFELREAQELEKRFQIPPVQEVLADQSAQNLVMEWCQHVRKESAARFFPSVSRPVRASPFQLMRLPHLFQDLAQRYVKERCPRCNNVPDRPALCLLCGALCCGSGPSGCCSNNLQSECQRHAIACGGGVGVYLMLKKTNVLLVRRERQAMWPSPYLDAFGEEDQDLRRGKPLYLSEERYAALTAMVASHGLDYSSSVLSHTTRDTMF